MTVACRFAQSLLTAFSKQTLVDIMCTTYKLSRVLQAVSQVKAHVALAKANFLKVYQAAECRQVLMELSAMSAILHRPIHSDSCTNSALTSLSVFLHCYLR